MPVHGDVITAVRLLGIGVIPQDEGRARSTGHRDGRHREPGLQGEYQAATAILRQIIQAVKPESIVCPVRRAIVDHRGRWCERAPSGTETDRNTQGRSRRSIVADRGREGAEDPAEARCAVDFDLHHEVGAVRTGHQPKVHGGRDHIRLTLGRTEGQQGHWQYNGLLQPGHDVRDLFHQAIHRPDLLFACLVSTLVIGQEIPNKLPCPLNTSDRLTTSSPGALAEKAVLNHTLGPGTIIGAATEGSSVRADDPH